MSKPTICIYHANCTDGCGAATIVTVALGLENVELYPGVYGEAVDADKVRGKGIVMVDFSYKREELLRLAGLAKTILILDHHKTAEEELVDLPGNVTAVFDMEQSGTMMAWNHYFPYPAEPTAVVKRIQDYDLWRHEYPESNAVAAALKSYEDPITPDAFYAWWELLTGRNSLKLLVAEGESILRRQKKDIEQAIRENVFEVYMAREWVPCLNVPHGWGSLAGHMLNKDDPFTVTYYRRGHDIVFSLRSSEDGLDVGKIARQFGGGGHVHAAGFTLGAEEARKRFCI